MLSKTEYKELLDDVCCGECKGDKYCTLKELLLHSNKDVRFIMQLKCIEKFKWEESERQGKDIGWDEASMLWVDRGLAVKFAKHYHEKIKFIVLYKNIISDV